MESDEDNFRPTFKYFRSKQPPPNLARVMAVNPHAPGVKLLSPGPSSPDCGRYCSQGLRPPKHWRVYALQDHPGLLVVRGAFTPEGELFWAAKCLMEYPDPPNMNNIENVKAARNNSQQHRNCERDTKGYRAEPRVNDDGNTNTGCASEKCTSFADNSTNDNNDNVINYPLSVDTMDAHGNIRDHKNTSSPERRLRSTDTTATDIQGYATLDTTATDIQGYATLDTGVYSSARACDSHRRLQVTAVDGCDDGSSTSAATDVPSSLSGPRDCRTAVETTRCAPELRGVGRWWKSVVGRGGPGGVAARELRWSTLGYHHDWDSKMYSENRRSPFPSCLQGLSSVVAAALADFLGVSEDPSTSSAPGFTAEKDENNTRLACPRHRQELRVRGGGKNFDVKCAEIEKKFPVVPSGRDCNLARDVGVTNSDAVVSSAEKSAETPQSSADIGRTTPHHTPASMPDQDVSKVPSSTTCPKHIDDIAVMETMHKSSVLSSGACDEHAFVRDGEAQERVSSNDLCFEAAAGSFFCLPQQLTRDQLENFRAEAAIVNYYHPGTSLGPHTDHSEPLYTAPLLSFSLGQPCVFLIGGPTKATRPTPLALQSGDVIVMGGATRMSYHAVPCVLTSSRWGEMGGRLDPRTERPHSREDPCPRCGETLPLAGVLSSQVQWDFVRQYLDANRINMNVRQVGNLLQRMVP